MPITNLLSELGIMPLRAIVFQSLLLMVAIVLEAMVLRQQLRLGYRPSMQYAATLNLLATSLGWMAFLAIEAMLPLSLRSQIISYVLFNRFYANSWREMLPVAVVLAAMPLRAVVGALARGVVWQGPRWAPGQRPRARRRQGPCACLLVV